MVKNVLHSVFAAMAIAFATDASAQTFYAGFPFSGSNPVEGTEGRMVSIDLSDLQTITGEYCTLPYNDSDGDSYVLAGTTVGDSYLAYIQPDYTPLPYFAWLNFETNTVTKIADAAISTAKDMTYDAVTDLVYIVSPVTSMSGGTNTQVWSVDVSDGSADSCTTFSNVNIEALVADGTGKAYAMGSVQTGFDLGANAYDLSLYIIDFAAKTCEKVRDLGTFSGTKTYATMTINDGTLYYIGGRKLYRINPAEGDMVQLGTLPFRNMTGVTFTKSTADGTSGQGGDDDDEEEDNGLRLTCVETYGDAMGQFADDVMSKRSVTFYDEYNNPVREVQYGRKAQPQLGENPWLMMYYTKYEYNADHRLVSRHSELVQEYVRGEYYYKSNNDTVKYEYDENGRLAQETTVASGQTISYEYDELGQLVKKVTTTPDRFGGFGAPDKVTTETYSGFVVFNQPSLIEIESPYSTTWKVVEFDADYHKVKTTTYSDEERTEATTVEHWTWRNDSIVEYATNRVYDGVEEPYKRTVYECEDGNPMRVRETSYYLSRDKWYRDGLPKVSCYSYLNAQFAPTNIAVEPVDDAVNTGKVTFTAPAFPVSEGTVSYDIYRMGVRVATITNDGEAFDPETGIFTYVDSIVPNGEYDYMVQTVVTNDATGDSTAYNVSEVVPMTYHVDLPAATNVRGEVVTVEDGANIVTIAWDAPENLDPNLLFEYYNIYVAGVGQANADDAGQIPITDTQYGVTFARSTQDIYVESVYHFGRVVSDTVTVDMRTLPNVGIDDAVQSVDGGKVSVSANEITVDGVASSVLVFSVGGAVEVSCRNVSRADISGLQPGGDVALGNIDGKNIAVKFTK